MTDQSFEEFVHASLPALSRHAYALTGSADRGEDLLQDTLLKVARAWRRVRRDGNPMAYARTTMLNTYLSTWRALRRRGTTVEYGDTRAGPDEYQQIDARDALRRALGALPRDQRVVLVLGYLDDLTDDQIATELGRKPSTVRSLRRRALQTLRLHLADHAQEPSHV